MKKILLLVTLFISTNLFAETTTNLGNIRPQPRPADLMSVAPSKYNTYKGYTSRCDRFVDANGALGDWGEALMDAIQIVGQNCFFEDVDMSVLCPNFVNFPVDRKMEFYAFLFAALAYDESSCHADAVGQGPNDRADGLFQLEYSQAQRADAARDPVFCATDRPVQTQNLDFQMLCTAATFRDGFCSRNRTPGRDFWYWEELNSENGNVSRVVRRFPYCGLPPE